MDEYFNAHLRTRFNSWSPKQKWFWVAKTFHPDACGNYDAGERAVRVVDLMQAMKDPMSWDRHFSNPDQRTRVTFPGRGDIESRTFNIPRTLPEMYTLLHTYTESQKGFALPPSHDDYPPVIQESDGTDNEPVDPREHLPYELTPTLASFAKVTSANALKQIVERIYAEYDPEVLLRVPVSKKSTDTVSLTQEANKQGLRLLTEQRGDVNSPEDLAQLALDVFNFPMQTIEHERHTVKGVYAGTRAVLKRDQYPDGYEARSRELVLNAFAEWVRNPEKTRTLKAAKKLIDSLPESNFYTETRKQLTSILADRKQAEARRKKRGSGSPEDLTN